MNRFYTFIILAAFVIPFTVNAESKVKKPPTQLAVEIINSNTAKLTWLGTLKDEAYRLRVRPVGAITWKEYFVVAPSNARRITDLLPGTTYQWQVQTVFGKAPKDTSAFTTGPNFKPWEPCETPQGLITMLDGTSKAALMWFSMGDGVRYNVRMRPEGTETWTSYTTDKNVLVVSGLTSHLGYEWFVSSECVESGLESEKSDKTYFATSPDVIYDYNPAANYDDFDNTRVVMFNQYGDDAAKAVLLDGMGRPVETLPVYYTASNGTVAFNVDNELPPGLYNVSYRCGEAVQSQTLLVAGSY